MLIEFLSENRDAVLDSWLNLIMDAYPADTAKFFLRDSNRFANPVGSNISENIRLIYDEILAGADQERIHGPLDRIIRIRAVQDLTPAQAVNFILLLKRAIREELDRAQNRPSSLEELLEFESRIDRTTLLAFEIYMGCREQIYRIRNNELRARSDRLLERMGVSGDEREWDQDP